jgi:hypothetical protein
VRFRRRIGTRTHGPHSARPPTAVSASCPLTAWHVAHNNNNNNNNNNNHNNNNNNNTSRTRRALQVRIFDLASTSLLEEYTQHVGRVVDLVFSHGAERLHSAGSDGVLCAYDALHAYQPSRLYAARPSAACSPCIALTKDDTVLVAGALLPAKLLIFEVT